MHRAPHHPTDDSAPDYTSPAVHRLRSRLTAGVLLALTAWLAFLIHYPYPVFPYLVLIVLGAALWRFRAGILCLFATLVTLAVTIFRSSAHPWRDGWDDLLALTLLGLVCLGARSLLDGLERQRRREQQLIAELSDAVAQLRASEQQQTVAAQALAERHQLLLTILDTVDNGIFLVDSEGWVRFANERLGELLGLDPHRVIGQEANAAVLQPLSERCRPGTETISAATWESPPGGSRRLIEIVYPAERLLYQYRAPVRDAAGREMGYLYVYSDLPGRERLQEMLAAQVSERTRELEAAHAELLRSTRLAALGQFSATMAHELRNPLNVVRLSIQYVTTRVSGQDEKLQRNLSHMNRSVDRACDIIEDLLTFSRLPPPQSGPTAINEVVTAAITTLPPPESVRVEWSLAPDLPLLLVDAAQIEQAVGNLGMNALQAMPEGGCLRVCTRREGQFLTITLQDTGPGIPEELRERVFEPFFSSRVTGTGLGLPLVREIALAHGGELRLESSSGEGACFTLSLPLTDTGSWSGLSASLGSAPPEPLPQGGAFAE